MVISCHLEYLEGRVKLDRLVIRGTHVCNVRNGWQRKLKARNSMKADGKQRCCQTVCIGHGAGCTPLPLAIDRMKNLSCWRRLVSICIVRQIEQRMKMLLW